MADAQAASAAPPERSSAPPEQDINEPGTGVFEATDEDIRFLMQRSLLPERRVSWKYICTDP